MEFQGRVNKMQHCCLVCIAVSPKNPSVNNKKVKKDILRPMKPISCTNTRIKHKYTCIESSILCISCAVGSLKRVNLNSCIIHTIYQYL